jgi:hypothetical protein
VAVWGMDVFIEYLKGKRFILYTDQKLLEKLGHLHSKTLKRLQMALLEHDFVIQYKKGSNMPADYLPRLPGVKDTVTSISAFGPTKQISTTSSCKTMHYRCYKPSEQKTNGLHSYQNKINPITRY